MSYLTAEAVHQVADGQWLMILQALSSNVLSAALQQPGKHVSCPVHGGKDGFRLFKDVQRRGGAVCNTCGVYSDGLSLLMWLNDWGFRQTLSEVGQWLGLVGARCSSHEGISGTSISSPSPEDKDRDAKVSSHINRIWRESLPYTDKVALPLRRYFHNRGIWFLHERIAPDDSLRFHQSLGYYDGPIKSFFPAMIGAVRDTGGQLLTLQRVYLNELGHKAAVAHPKKLMPFPKTRQLTGSAIPLGRPGQGVLGIAEGVETALAVASVTPYPVWSSVNAHLMEHFEPPPGVHTLLIWADRDRSSVGERAANRLKRKLMARGIQVYVFLPDPREILSAKSLDWNDVLLQQGTGGFPIVEDLNQS